jgi:hypothetical protein
LLLDAAAVATEKTGRISSAPSQIRGAPSVRSEGGKRANEIRLIKKRPNVHIGLHYCEQMNMLFQITPTFLRVKVKVCIYNYFTTFLLTIATDWVNLNRQYSSPLSVFSFRWNAYIFRVCLLMYRLALFSPPPFSLHTCYMSNHPDWVD